MLRQPGLHPRDFMLLRTDNFLSQCAHFWVLAVGKHRFRHGYGTLMVGDHSGHKIYVSIAGEANVHAPVHGLITFLKGLRRWGVLRRFFTHQIVVLMVCLMGIRSVCGSAGQCQQKVKTADNEVEKFTGNSLVRIPKAPVVGERNQTSIPLKALWSSSPQNRIFSNEKEW